MTLNLMIKAFPTIVLKSWKIIHIEAALDDANQEMGSVEEKYKNTYKPDILTVYDQDVFYGWK